MFFLLAGGGKDLETAAAFVENSIATTSASTVTIPTKIGISSTFMNKPIKIQIPALSGAASSSKPIMVKSIGSVNTVDGKQIRFIPPKVNTANNRVPAGTGNSSGGSGEQKQWMWWLWFLLVLTTTPCVCSLSLFLFNPLPLISQPSWKMFH